MKPTPADLAALKAEIQAMTGLELLYATLTDPRFEWLDDTEAGGDSPTIPVRGGAELNPGDEHAYRMEQADYDG